MDILRAFVIKEGNIVEYIEVLNLDRNFRAFLRVSMLRGLEEVGVTVLRLTSKKKQNPRASLLRLC